MEVKIFVDDNFNLIIELNKALQLIYILHTSLYCFGTHHLIFLLLTKYYIR